MDEPAGEAPSESERLERIEAVLRHVRAQMPHAEIDLRGSVGNEAWATSLRERGILGPPSGGGEASGWRIELSLMDGGATSGGGGVVRAKRRIHYPGGAGAHYGTYLLAPDAAGEWRVVDERLERTETVIPDPLPEEQRGP